MRELTPLNLRRPLRTLVGAESAGIACFRVFNKSLLGIDGNTVDTLSDDLDRS